MPQLEIEIVLVPTRTGNVIPRSPNLEIVREGLASSSPWLSRSSEADTRFVTQTPRDPAHPLPPPNPRGNVSNSSHSTEPFEIQAPEGEFLIELFNGSGARVWNGSGPTTLQLPKGLYQLRTVAGESVHDTFVRHEGPTLETAKAPAYLTPAPLSDASTSREYYTHPARIHSEQPTGNPFAVPRTLRTCSCSSELLGGTTCAARTSGRISDSRRTRARPLAGDARFVQRGTEGWLALSIPAPPGVYQLSTSDRSMAIQVMDGWCTQVFVSFIDTAHLETAVVFLDRRGQPFAPEDEVARAVDRGPPGPATRRGRPSA